LDGDLFGIGDDNEKTRDSARNTVIEHFTQELDGMAFISDKFNYDQCLELIKLTSPEKKNG
jgi:hypothetical protein